MSQKIKIKPSKNPLSCKTQNTIKTIKNKNPYHPSRFLRNGHVNTILTTSLRKLPSLNFQRERFETADDDFLDLDILRGENKRVAFLCHGLEGSSQSQYIIGTADLLSRKGWDVVCLNYRSCSGEMNRQMRTYHCGTTDDLHTIVESYASAYKEIALVGFSLGGNMILKYAGDEELPLNKKIKKQVVVSVPVDLEAGAYRIASFQNRLYEFNFLQTLKQKAKIKDEQFPGVVDLEKVLQCKRLMEFDHHFTAPVHGFADAFDYYKQCNSLQFLHQIKTPTLIINAKDDPFLPMTCYPYEQVEENPFLQMLVPDNGGHVGFYLGREEASWAELEIHRFLEDDKPS